jgi:hypothetical protein
MKKLKSRVQEGGAMDNSSEMTMEKYSKRMKKMLVSTMIFLLIM